MTAFGRSRGGAVARAPTHWTRFRGAELLALVAIACITLTAGSSRASFTDDVNSANVVAAARIFSGVRTTTGFIVRDASGGGAESDQSSPLAFGGDGRAMTTGAWAATFGANRFLQVDLNAPLPAGLPASGATFRLTFASSSPAGTACVYIEVRRISDDAVEASYGGSGAPLACVSGTTLATLDQPIPVVGSTGGANDLRVRVYGRDTAGVGSIVDQAVVNGATAYASFTLYPVRITDAADGTPITVPWRLQGP
jgi:hypothetical protein